MRGSRLRRLWASSEPSLIFLGCQVTYFIVYEGFLLTYGNVSSIKSLLRDGLHILLQAVQREGWILSS